MARTIIQIRCPFCMKIGEELSRESFGDEILINFKCGHSIVHEALKTDDLDIVSSDGRTLFPFQKETVKFIEDADCNGMVLHEQGLGKTVIACSLLKRNKDLLPALIVVKSGLRLQWFAEMFRWTGIIPQVISSSRELPYFDVFPVVIVSIDTLRLLRPDVKETSELQKIRDEMGGGTSGKRTKSTKPIWTDEICAKFKFVIVDESQKIKNPGASRTQALRKIIAAANGGQKARVMPMSGTNIEKNAGEFFVTLNLCRPELFPHQSQFQVQHCEINPMNGKIMGLKNPERFRELTKDFIIRYKREQVLPDLPKVFRQFRLAEMEGGELEAYIKVVKDFQEAMEDPEHPPLPTDILGYLSKMRHITGIAKVKAAVEFVEEFLLESERKLVIFLHHQMAAAILMKKLDILCKDGAFNPPLQLHSGLDMEQRAALVEEFKKPGNRIAVMSTLAAGEGLNLQFCSDCLIMERQWNPSAEEQAEGRFPRPGSTADKINAHYLIAAGTIDDFLTDIVEIKRRNVTQTLDGTELIWDESSLIGELTRVIMTKGLKKWKL